MAFSSKREPPTVTQQRRAGVLAADYALESTTEEAERRAITQELLQVLGLTESPPPTNPVNRRDRF